MERWKKEAAGYIPSGHQPEARTQAQLLADAYEEILKPYPSVKLPGYPLLSQVTGGFRPNEYTILCGATGTGKTTLMANISAQLSRGGVPHYVASIETGPSDFIKRVMSAVRGRDWNTGDPVSVDEVKDFHAREHEFLSRQNVWLGMYDNRVKAEKMLADLAYMVLHHGVKVAIIDNFNFMQEVVTQSRQVVEEDRVLHEYVMFCKRVPLHLIMVHHPKKTDNARVESEFDVKGSSTAVQEAQNVLLWNRISPKLVEQGLAREDDRELKVAKMRRRGKFVGKKLIMRAYDGVSYTEVTVL